MMEFDGKVALVTGAGSGMGEAVARRLAAKGAVVGVLDVVASGVDSVCAGITADGGRAVPLLADVADETAVQAAVQTLISEAGRLDIVLANAGINGVWAPIEELQPHEFDRTIAINLRGTYLTLHFAVPHLKAAGGGAIVIVSSINGTRTFTTAGATAYTATKAAQAAMSNQLAIELGRHGIRVNAICPGSTRTNIGLNTDRRNTDAARFPVNFPEGDVPISGGKPASTDEIADAIEFLVSERSRHINGTWLHVDGGQSLLR